MKQAHFPCYALAKKIEVIESDGIKNVLLSGNNILVRPVGTQHPSKWLLPNCIIPSLQHNKISLKFSIFTGIQFRKNGSRLHSQNKVGRNDIC